MQIYEMLSKASARIAQKGVGKTGVYSDGKANWNFREYDKIMVAVTAAMNECGLSLVPLVESEILEERVKKTQYGETVRYYARVRVRYTLYASDGSHVESVMIGEGLDSGDKAINKALTAAHKYLCMQLFAIPVEGAPENEHTVPDEEPPKKPKKTALTTSDWPDTERRAFFSELRESGIDPEHLTLYLRRDGGKGLSERTKEERAKLMEWVKSGKAAEPVAKFMEQRL